MIKTGITGGIGSGKTMVSSILVSMGYPVYFADLRGSWLTNNHPTIIKEVKNLFGSGIYTSKGLDRQKVAQIVFSNKPKLEQLNQIIHPVVGNDFSEWLKIHQNHSLVFKEAAIMFESGAHKNLDRVICVTAPQILRIRRVLMRDGGSEEQVLARISNQMTDDERLGMSDFVINNDGRHFVLKQLNEIINKLKQELRP